MTRDAPQGREGSAPNDPDGLFDSNDMPTADGEMTGRRSVEPADGDDGEGDDEDGDDGGGLGGESERERLNRNWSEILQELRVIQAGSQIITGFLLAVAFQPRFEQLDSIARVVYLVLLVTAIATTIVGLAPVMLHRRLFQKGAKRSLVRLGDRLAIAALAGVGITLAGIALLIVEMVVGLWAGIAACALVGAALVLLWLALPWRQHRRKQQAEAQSSGPRPASNRSR